MTGKQDDLEGDATPIVVGRGLYARSLRDMPDPAGLPTDPLGKHIAILFILHPEIADRFKHISLPEMDDVAKRSLLGELNELLGIRPLRECQP